MARRASEKKRMEWRERLDRFSTSNLTVSAFCERESISVASFYQWRRKLSAGVSDSTVTSPAPNSSASHGAAAAKATFVQLASSRSTPAQMEVALANGTVIRVGADQVAAIAAIATAFASPTSNGGRADA